MAGIMYDTEMVLDLSGDYPERQARITLNVDDVAEFRRACYDAGNYNRHHTFNLLDATLFDAMFDFLQRVEKQLMMPSLAGMEEWKATSGAQ